MLLVLIGCNPDSDSILVSPTDDELLINLLVKRSPTNSIDYYIQPNENDLSAIPEDPLNPLTKEKVELGKLLFHDPAIGSLPKVDLGMQTYSCASCHHADAGFQAGVLQGIGEGGLGFGEHGEQRFISPIYPIDSIDVQPIRTPTILNSAFQTNMLWNGMFGATGVNVNTEDFWIENSPKETNFLGFEGLETQAIAGIGVHRIGVDYDLVVELGYTELFNEAFSDWPFNERYSDITAGLALAAYERTVLANHSPFQLWLKNQSILSQTQIQGAMLFFDKAECYKCHSGPGLNDMSFHAIGMADLMIHDDVFIANPFNTESRGRGGFTGRSEDDYKFKVPQLYNLVDSPFYGHGSSFATIKSIVEYKNTAIPENPRVPNSQISEYFKPLNLSQVEIAQLVDFIENALYDPDLNRYVPESLPSGFCFPNADQVSLSQLNCN